MQMKRSISALAAAGALAVAGCGGSGGDQENVTQGKESASQNSGTQSTPESKVGAPNAKVEFVTPGDGDKLNKTVMAEVSLENFTIDAKSAGKAAKEGTGHLHFTMDGGKFDQPKYSGANGELAKKLGVNGQYSPSVTPTITYKNLPKGEHTLEVTLANNDHSSTGVQSKTTFTIR